MSAAKKRREAVIPREADYLRWRRLCEKNVVTKDFDKYGRKLYGHAAETKRVYMASANHTLHVRSYVKLRPLLKEQRSINGGNGELALLECCADGRTIRFARDPDIPEDVAKEVEEAQQHGDIPGATKFVHAFNSARLFDHTVQQQTVFDGFLPSMLDIIMHGAQSCLVLYGERGSGKSYSLFGRDMELDYSEQERYKPTEEEIQAERLLEANRPSTRGSSVAASSRPTTANSAHAHAHTGEDGCSSLLSADHHADSVLEESELAEKEEKDLEWLQVEDEGMQTGIMQRAIEYLYDQMNQGKFHRQSRYKLEMQCIASQEGRESVCDMLHFDPSGKPRECFVHWDNKLETFEALGADFVAYKDRKDMIYAALRANFLIRHLGMKACTLVYKFRMDITGIGDSDWTDMVGDQLPEGQPRTGEFTLIKSYGFEIPQGYPDEFGKDGIFANNETLRLVIETLEKQNYNNLPALRKKPIVPYRNHSVTKLMSRCLTPGSIVVLLGSVGCDKDSHVGTLHTLWAASKVHKPKTHKVLFKRALNKLRALGIMNKGGNTFANKTTQEQASHALQLKSIVEDHTQANLHHILVDKHLQKLDHSGDRTADHTTQLMRALPRLDKRRESISKQKKVSVPDVYVKRVRLVALDKQEKDVDKTIMALKEQYDQEEERKRTEKINALFKRKRGPVLRGTGGTIDAKGFLSPMVGIIQFDKINSSNGLSVGQKEPPPEQHQQQFI